MKNPTENKRSLGERDIDKNVRGKVTEGRPLDSITTQYYRTGDPCDSTKSMRSWLHNQVEKDKTMEWTDESLRANKVKLVNSYEEQYSRKS